VSGVEVQDGIKSEAVRGRIAALLDKLRGRKLLKRSELERQLLLAADTPGVALHASAKPDPSAADKVVLVVSGTFERFEPVAQVDSFSTVPDTSVNFRVAGIGLPGDSLRVMRGGLTTAFKDDWKGTWGAAALASVGLDLAGAETANRFSAAPSFFKLNLALERAQPIGKSFTFVARAVGQITSGTVPAAEVFTYGGREFGRAFNLSESFGDRGAAVSAELRYAIDWIDFLKDKADPQLYVFADHGWLSSDDPRNAPLFTQASSAGGGIRVIGFKKYTAEFEFAKALDATPIGVGGRPWRVSVRVGTKF
jgi:hemolysin activation/secretion protein